RWRIEPDYAIKVDPSLGLLGVLLEPTTVVAKAWEQVVAIGQRVYWEPRTVLVTGAGPIGLLAAPICVQHRLEFDGLGPATGVPKPELVSALGATYHATAIADIGFAPDVIMECTGVGSVISDSIAHVGSGGIVCLTGVGTGGSAGKVPTADAAAAAVLKNNVVVGSGNANKRHWYKGSQALARADRSWLSRMITRRERPGNFDRAIQRNADDIKVVIQFKEA